MPKYNLKAKPKEILTVGSKKDLYIEIPVYGDLKAQEAEQLEQLNIHYQRWTQKLFKLAQDIAEVKQLSLVEVLTLISTEDIEGQAEKFGEFLEVLALHASQKPNETDKLIHSAFILLKSRVDPEITLEDIKDLPLEFLKQINDVVFMETSREYFSAQSLKEENSLLQEMVNLAETGIDSCIKTVHLLEEVVPPEYKQELTGIVTELSAYYDLKASLGK